MSQLQSRLALLDQQISFTALLHVAGADIWKDEDIRAYMDKVHKEQPVGILYRLFGEQSTTVNFFISLIVGTFAYCVTASLQTHFDHKPDQFTMIVALCTFVKTFWNLYRHYEYGPFDWHTNPVFDIPTGMYWRNWKQFYVPQGALLLMKRVKTVVPYAEFAVSFIGSDPVLWCSDHDGAKRESVAIRVWDEVNGVELFVPAPR